MAKITFITIAVWWSIATVSAGFFGIHQGSKCLRRPELADKCTTLRGGNLGDSPQTDTQIDTIDQPSNAVVSSPNIGSQERSPTLNRTVSTTVNRSSTVSIDRGDGDILNNTTTKTYNKTFTQIVDKETSTTAIVNRTLSATVSKTTVNGRGDPANTRSTTLNRTMVVSEITDPQSGSSTLVRSAEEVSRSAEGNEEGKVVSKTAREEITKSVVQDGPPLPRVSPWRAALPERLRRKSPRTLQFLQLGRCDIYLLGTAHVSNDSSVDVDLLLKTTQPDSIFVELCDARVAMLEGTDPTPEVNETTSFFERLKSTREAQGGSLWQALCTLLLTSVQEDYAKELNVELGGEFRCAYQYWEENYNRLGKKKPHLILGDRPVSITLVRAWESLGFFSRIKVVIGLLISSFQKPDKEELRKWLESVMNEESDVLTKSFEKLRRHFPSLYTTIIDERDQWLAAKLVQLSRLLSSAPHLRYQPRIKVVAIVGAGHVPGICGALTRQSSLTPEQLLSNLVTTQKWKGDANLEEAMQLWVNDVTELRNTAQ